MHFILLVLPGCIYSTELQKTLKRKKDLLKHKVVMASYGKFMSTFQNDALSKEMENLHAFPTLVVLDNKFKLRDTLIGVDADDVMKRVNRS